MVVPYVDPRTGAQLARDGDQLVGPGAARYPIVRDVPRFCEEDNYTSSFGKQWNLFDRTQIDQGHEGPTATRLFAETGWDAGSLDGLDILEVGSGAGRFSRVILTQTGANLYSLDYSAAVDANWHTNRAAGGDRFHLAQASIYDMPFPDGAFDKILCLGVLQHTPDFGRSVAALIRKAAPGGEIVVDFYPIRGWWTKVHAKYLLRPLTKRMNHDRLLALIDRHADRLIRFHELLTKAGLAALTRFLPLVDLRTLPGGLTPSQRREWAVLDTFDMFSPAYDNPQRIDDVAAMFERHGAEVTFAGYAENGSGAAAVVRARRRP